MIVRTSSSYSTDESDQGFNILGPSTQTSPKSAASQFTQSQHPEKTQTKSQLVNRGAFQSKVLSREHAEFTVLMGEDGRMKLSITDLNSSMVVTSVVEMLHFRPQSDPTSFDSRLEILTLMEKVMERI